jgi:urease accessory protein UreF
LEDQARQGVNAPELSEHQSLQSALHRGWYRGSEQFREYLLKKLDAEAIPRNRNYQAHKWSACKKGAANVSRQLSRAKKAAKPKIEPAKPAI